MLITADYTRRHFVFIQMINIDHGDIDHVSLSPYALDLAEAKYDKRSGFCVAWPTTKDLT